MRFNKYILSGLTALAALSLAPQALAGGRNPGSLLLYPEFDSRAGVATVITITNTSVDMDVTVEFVYIGRYDAQGNLINCAEFNRNEDLTANDTLTLITNVHNPQFEQGFVYAFAKDAGAPVDHDYLIGNVMTVDSLEAFEYSMNPVVYTGLVDGDTNSNGLRDMDGVEYEEAAAEILVPRFLGQGGPFDSELILIGLSGGAAFNTTVDFLI